MSGVAYAYILLWLRYVYTNNSQPLSDIPDGDLSAIAWLAYVLPRYNYAEAEVFKGLRLVLQSEGPSAMLDCVAKGVTSWPKVSSLVFWFRSLP